MPVKGTGAISKVAKIIDSASNKAVRNVLSNYNGTITGREEAITAQLQSEITQHLLEYVRTEINDKTFNGVHFSAYVFKASNSQEETNSGADIAGIIRIVDGTSIITKYYLAQAKVGYQDKSGNFKTHSNQDLQTQATKMLRITSDSFILVYTPNHIVVIPAYAINSSSINTKYQFFKYFGNFYEEFLKCFIGDHLAVLQNIKPEDLGLFTEKIKANNILLIEAVTNNQTNNPNTVSTLP